MANYRQELSVEVVKNERSYKFYLPVGAPLGEAYDAAHEVLKGIVDMSDQAAKAAQRPQEAPAPIQPEVVDKS